MPQSIRLLHICTEKGAGPTVERLTELAQYLEGKVAEQLFVCAEASELHVFCDENDLLSFPVSTGFFSLFPDAALLGRICENYGIDIVHVHDDKAAAIAGLAAKKIKAAFVSDVAFQSGWLGKRFQKIKNLTIIDKINSPAEVLDCYRKLV
jgi:hypothetical protein